VRYNKEIKEEARSACGPKQWVNAALIGHSCVVSKVIVIFVGISFLFPQLQQHPFGLLGCCYHSRLQGSTGWLGKLNSAGNLLT